MVTFYTCTQVTPEVYAAYVRYSPSGAPFAVHELQAVTLCINDEGVTIFPIGRGINERHLRKFGSTDPQSANRDSNILVSAEEFFRQLFMLELDQ